MSRSKISVSVEPQLPLQVLGLACPRVTQGQQVVVQVSVRPQKRWVPPGSGQVRVFKNMSMQPPMSKNDNGVDAVTVTAEVCIEPFSKNWLHDS